MHDRSHDCREEDRSDNNKDQSQEISKESEASSASQFPAVVATTPTATRSFDPASVPSHLQLGWTPKGDVGEVGHGLFFDQP